MSIVLFARRGEPTAASIAEQLVALGATYAWLSWSAIGQGTPVAFDGVHYVLDGHPLRTCKAYWLHQYPGESAQVARAGEQTLAVGDWWTRTQLQKERSHLAKSALRSLDRGGAYGVNSFSNSMDSHWKPHQLELLRRAGLPLPATLISNQPAQILDFVAGQRAVVIKPIAGGAEAVLWSEPHRARLAEVRTEPAIFQQRIFGKIIRVTVVGDEIASAVEIPSDTLDYRADPAYRDGEVQYLPHALRPEGHVFALAAARACGHVVSGIDMIDSTEGYVLLEANGAPRFLEIEQKTGAEISAKIARLLVRQADAS